MVVDLGMPPKPPSQTSLSADASVPTKFLDEMWHNEVKEKLFLARPHG